MALKDVLLHLDSYPEATPDAMIDSAVGLAAALGAQLTALAVQVQFPVKSNRVADYLIGLSALAQDEAARSRANAEAALAHFTAAAKAAGVFQEARLDSALIYDVADRVAERARTRDLCIVPLAERFDGQQEVAQSVVFGSGRPVLAMGPQAAPPAGETGLGLAVLAWDGSRSAARAMADALPILKKARQVHVLTVVNDKPAAVAGLGEEAVRHLTQHGVAALAREIDADGLAIGETLAGYLKAEGADLLVMGAYGHSRLREFVLGGATEHMLHEPPTPVLMAH
ncbi:universal stress protein [Phenylobacterium sp.]|uniref:universal stress protein n=1 Tax=Phenylobacterium sp. TaxID=1871053 RepID=UPI0035B3EA4A